MDLENLENLLLEELRQYFGDDIKRIKHAEAVLEFTKEISKIEGGDQRIIIPTAILHDIGLHECERKYNSTSGHFQEKESPRIAKIILSSSKYGFAEQEIDEICNIIAHHHTANAIKGLNFRVIWDADWLVNFGDEINLTDSLQTAKMIAKIFVTSTGQKIAERLYL